jgi:hypothetical protein
MDREDCDFTDFMCFDLSEEEESSFKQQSTSSTILLEPRPATYPLFIPLNEGEETPKEPTNIKDFFNTVEQLYSSQKQNITPKQVFLAFLMFLLLLTICAPAFVSFSPATPSTTNYSQDRPLFSPAVKFRMRRPVVSTDKDDEIPLLIDDIPLRITASIVAFFKNLGKKISGVLVCSSY